MFDGIVTMVKLQAKAIWNYMEMLHDLVTFDFSGMKKNAGQMIDNLKGLGTNAFDTGKQLGKDFHNGWQSTFGDEQNTPDQSKKFQPQEISWKPQSNINNQTKPTNNASQNQTVDMSNNTTQSALQTQQKIKKGFAGFIQSIRQNSKKATQFRVWATKVLRSHILDGYTINEDVLSGQSESFKKLQRTLNFLNSKSRKKQLVGQEKEILGLLSDYSKTLSILEKYDNNKLDKIKGRKESFVLEYRHCLSVIKSVKKDLISKKEATNIFGNEINCGLEAVINNLFQTFNRKKLYSGIESKASHLFYFIIKDHPFSDGNKRIGSFLFVYFLDKNNYLYKKKGGVKISDSALTALALLVAESHPREKEVMVSLIENLILDK
jgi:prophage maintenance system killer protein